MVTTVLRIFAFGVATERANQGRDPICDEGSTSTGDG
jgi:hypothetical protein